MCVDNIFILNEVIQGRLQEGKKMIPSGGTGMVQNVGYGYSR